MHIRVTQNLTIDATILRKINLITYLASRIFQVVCYGTDLLPYSKMTPVLPIILRKHVNN